jgi:hypothetical protein
MQDIENDLLRQALIKKATGYDTDEVITEYVFSDDEERIVKKKVTTKSIPPDITAIKMLLSTTEDYNDLSDEQLVAERDRLIGLLTKN